MKLILRPALRQVQLISAEILAHSDVRGCTVLDVAEDFDLRGALVDWTTMTVGLDPDAQMNVVRVERDQRLAATDKYVLPDFPMSDAVRQAWLTYRRALRQIPETQPDATLDTVEWPVAPN